jgi:hypothetical protein
MRDTVSEPESANDNRSDVGARLKVFAQRVERLANKSVQNKKAWEPFVQGLHVMAAFSDLLPPLPADPNPRRLTRLEQLGVDMLQNRPSQPKQDQYSFRARLKVSDDMIRELKAIGYNQNGSPLRQKEQHKLASSVKPPNSSHHT